MRDITAVSVIDDGLNIETLVDLGLTGTQAKVYLALSEKGTSSIKEIAKASKVARPDTYRAINDLIELGLIEKIVMNPAKFRPLSIADTISILVSRRKKEFIELDKRAEALIKNLEEKKKNPKLSEDSQLILIPRGEALELKLVKMLENAEEKVSLIVPRQRLFWWVDNNYETIVKALKRKVAIQVITEETHEAVLSKQVRQLGKFRHFQIRYLTMAPSAWFRIFDGKEIVLTTAVQSDQVESPSVWSNNQSLVELAQSYFDAAWFTAIEPQDRAFKRDRRQFDYLFANITNGFSYNKMLFGDDGKPIDFVILEINDAFEEITGFGQSIIGKRATEVYTSLMKDPTWLFTIYGEVVNTGKGATFEFYSQLIEKWLSVLAYSPEKGYVATLIEDITQRKKAEQELEKQKNKAERYLNIVGNIILAMDTQAKVTLLNKKGYEILSYEEGELQGKDWVETCLPEENKAELKNFLEAWIQGKVKTPGHHENPILTKTGEIRIVSWYNTDLRDENGCLVGMLSAGEDITERKKAEEKLGKLNRALIAISKSNRLQISAPDYVEYAREVCKIINQDCGYQLAWVGFAEEDKDRTVRPIAYAGFDKDYIDSLKITWADNERGQGPIGTAIRTGKPRMSRNIHADPNFEPWREQATRKGYTSSIALPLMSGGKAFGALNIYSKDPDPFTGEEVNLLTELANDFAYGITTIKLRAEKERAEEALQVQQRILSSIYSNVSETLFSLSVEPDNRFRFISVNQSFLDTTGLLENQVVGKRVQEVIPEPSLSIVLAKYQQAVRENKTVKWEEVTDYPAGKKYGEVTVTPLFDSNGHCTNIIGNVHDITERKKAEERLEKEQQELDCIIDSSPIIIFYKDKEGKFIRVNKTFAEALKIPEEEFLGKTVFDFYSAEIAQSMTNDDSEVLKSGRPKLNIIEQYESASGIRWTQTSKVPTFDKNGTPTGIVGFAQDITEQKKAEKALRVSEEKISKAFQSSPSAIVLTRMTDGAIVEANQSAVDILGYSREEILGHSTLEMGVWANPDDQIRFTKELSVRGFVRNEEYAMRKKDGTEGTLSVSAEIIDIEQERYLLVSFIDITEQTEAKEALVRSEARFKGLAESISDVFFAMDKDLRYTYWNRASEKLTGISAEDAIGKSLTEVFPNVKDTEIEQFYRNVLRTKDHQTFVHKYRVKEKDFIFEIDAYPTKGGISVFTKDITERMKTEEQLKESEHRLRETLDSMIEGCQIINYDWRYKYVNDAVAKHGRTTKEKLMGKTMMEVYPGIEKIEVFSELQRCMRERVSTSMENEFNFPDGSKGWFDLHIEPVPQGILILSIDITESKKAEEALRESENQFRSLAENAPDMIMRFDRNLRVLYINLQAERVTGIPAEKYIGKTNEEIGMPENICKVWNDLFQKASETRQPQQGEFDFQGPTGTRYYDLRIVPEIGNDGLVKTFMGISRDITELKTRNYISVNGKSATS